MRVSHFLQDRDFSVDSIDIRLVLDLVLFQNLDGNLVASYNVCTLLYLSKRSLPLCLAYNEPSNFLSFTILLFFLTFLITIEVSWWRFRAIFVCFLIRRGGIFRFILICIFRVMGTTLYISALNCNVFISILIIRCLVIISFIIR